MNSNTNIKNTTFDLNDFLSTEFPDKAALKYREHELTYSELANKINSLGSQLIAQDIKPSDRIGIYLNRSHESVIAILAIINIGAVYVPLDPNYPEERLQFILNDSSLKAIITSSDVKNQNLDIKKINIGDKLNTERKSFTLKFEGNIPAYLIYTSGSSGMPKGVEVTRSNLYNFIRLSSKSLNVNSSDVCLFSASINYALSIRQIFVPLSKGAKLIVADFEHLQDPKELLTLIKNEKVTLVDFVPSHLRSLIDYLKSLDELQKNELLSNFLRRIVTVGEALTADIVNSWYHELKQTCSIVNIFGQTETTGIVCLFTTNNKEVYSGIIPIGTPIKETELYVLDENLSPVKQGNEGELCISNPCVANGYLNQYKLTSEKFISNPFDKSNSSKLYRTGDLCRLRKDGNLDFLGRLDSQIKIRGMRVEIDDIESNINSYPYIKRSIVTLNQLESGSQRLISFLVLKEVDNIDIEELKNYLFSRMPSHMIPTQFVIVDSFPLTPNGKIDRKALKEIKIDNESEESQSEINSEIEKKLLYIWKQVLNNKDIYISSNFFEKGGDSLTAVNLFILIEKQFHVVFPISVLYQNPTIQLLAKEIENESSSSVYKSIVPIRTAGSKSPLFFVHGAGGNILLYQDFIKYLDPEIPFYGLQAFGLDGKSEIIYDVKTMAIMYLSEIRKVQQKGPYYLGGYCMGGTVAFEIAQQLKKSGEEVNALILLETYNWCSLPQRNIFDKSHHSFQKGLFHLFNLLLLNWKDKKEFLSRKWKELKSRKSIWLGKFKNWFYRKSIDASQYDRILAEVWRANDLAAFSYQSEYYQGEIIQFLPLRRYKIHQTESADWQKLAKKVNIETLPVYAAGMLLEPFVKTLADKINQILLERQK